MRVSALLCVKPITFLFIVTKYLIGINLKREGFLWIIVEGNHPTIVKILASGMVAGGGG